MIPAMSYSGMPHPYFGIPYQSETERGLKYFHTSFILYFIALVLLMVLALVIVFALITTNYSSDEDIDHFFGILMMVIVIAFVAVVIMFISFILWILGFYSMNRGKHEFGEVHAQRVSKAVILFIIWIVVTIIAAIVSAVMAFIAGFGTTTVVSGSFSIISAVLLGQSLVNVIHELVDGHKKNRLRNAFILYVIGPVISLIISLIALSAISLSDLSYTDTTTVENGIRNLNSLSAIPQLIAFYLFFTCFKSALERVRNRDIEPVAPTFPSPGAYPPPPGLYPPPAYGYYPPPVYGYPPYPPPHGAPFPSRPPHEGGPKDDRKRIQCPKCEHRFRVESHVKEVQCPSCGAKGEL